MFKESIQIIINLQTIMKHINRPEFKEYYDKGLMQVDKMKGKVFEFKAQFTSFCK